MFTGDGNGVVKVWACVQGKWSLLATVTQKEIEHDPVNSLRLHPHGKRLLVHARDNMLRVLDLRTYSFMEVCFVLFVCAILLIAFVIIVQISLKFIFKLTIVIIKIFTST